MSLGKRQEEFMEMLGLLLYKAHALGYKVRPGHLKRCKNCKVGMEFSLHKEGLAIDLHLFKDGVYLTDGTGHDVLHDFWDSIGGAKRIANDLNHYSLGWGGRL